MIFALNKYKTFQFQFHRAFVTIRTILIWDVYHFHKPLEIRHTMNDRPHHIILCICYNTLSIQWYSGNRRVSSYREKRSLNTSLYSYSRDKQGQTPSQRWNNIQAAFNRITTEKHKTLNQCWFNVGPAPYTLNNIGSTEGALQYYYHATPGEPLQGSSGVAW